MPSHRHLALCRYRKRQQLVCIVFKKERKTFAIVRPHCYLQNKRLYFLPTHPYKPMRYLGAKRERRRSLAETQLGLKIQDPLK